MIKSPCLHTMLKVLVSQGSDEIPDELMEQFEDWLEELDASCELGKLLTNNDVDEQLYPWMQKTIRDWWEREGFGD